MFISKREADERLRDAANLFRDDSSTPPDTRAEVLEEAEQELKQAEVSHTDPSHADPQKQDVIGLDQLDRLINLTPRNRMKYQGNMSAQVAIAETAMILGPSNASKLFGLGIDQTVAYANGSDTGGTSKKHKYNMENPRPERRQRIDALRERLSLRAGLKLRTCLDLLSDDKLAGIKKATNIARVAKDMAVIMDKVSDRDKDTDGGIHFHLYRPEIREESQYDVIEIGSKL